MVTLNELKAHLRIEADDENDYLGMLLRIAEAAVADFCGQSFSDAPEPVRLAVLLFAGYHYAHREADDASAHSAMTAAFHALLWPHREPGALF
jgi:hypothetical protein